MEKNILKKMSVVLLAALVFFYASPVISWAASFFYVDDQGNVAIGNAAPQHKLDVSGSMYSRLVTLTNSSATAVNWNDGNIQSLALGISNTTLTFSNAQAGGEYKLILKQDSTGGRTVTWPTSVKWEGATAPTLTSTANTIDMASFVFDGTNYLGTFSLDHETPPAVIFSDDFNRSNSSTVGNGWSEGVYTTWSSEGEYPDRNTISGNAIRQTTFSSLGGGTISRTYSGATTNIKITGRITWASNTNAFVFLKSTADSWATGWGMVLGGGGVAVRDGGTNKAFTSFTLTPGVSYDFEMQINASNHAFIYLWPTSGSKPGTPTVSWENGGNPYTLTETGSLLSLTIAPNSSGDYGSWDYLEIMSQ